MKKNHLFIMFLLLSLSRIINAQPGSLDTSFNPEIETGAFIKACILQNDGKIMIGGSFSKGIARLNIDGTIDTGFTAGTGTDGVVAAIAIQSDEKIIMGGSFTSYNGTNINRIARLNSDGTLDTTFKVGAGVDTSWYSYYPFGVHAITIQTDEKIIIGGNFGAYNGKAINNLARLNINGTLDTSFMIGDGPNFPVLSIAMQNDGKIIIGGRFYYTDGGTISFMYPFLARLYINGTLDSAFSKNISIGPTNVSQVNTLSIQSDGKIIIGGNFNYCNGSTAKRIARLTADGTLDTTFLLNQVPLLYYEVHTLAVQADGKILMGGEATLPSSDSLNRIVRLTSDGALDNAFTTGLGVNGGDVYAVAIQNDGKIIIGGNFSAYDGTVRNGIARLNTENSSSGLIAIEPDVQTCRIIPNPNNGFFGLHINEELQHAAIRIMDALGKEVYSTTVTIPHSTYMIDLSNQAEGIYYVIVNTNGKHYRNTIIVNK